MKLKLTTLFLVLWLVCQGVYAQAIFVPRSFDKTIVKGMNGGTTTAGIALCGSSTANGLGIADWGGVSTACIGFSTGTLGEVIVAGKVKFDLGGLTPNTDYYLGENGTITTTAGTSTGLIQKVIRAIGTDTGIILSDEDLTGGAGGTSTVWGDIVGTLSNQTDLQSALDGKEDSLGFTPEDSADKAAANGYASLDANTKVVQNPASGTSTPGVDKLVISLGSGLIDDGWLSSNITKLGSSVDIDELNDVTITAPSSGEVLKYNGSAWVNDTATGGSGTNLTITGLTGGTTTTGCALYFSANNTLSTATYTGSNTAAIGFSNGSTGQIIVSGIVTIPGLEVNKWYLLGENGSVTTTGTTTSGYINQMVLYSTGTNTGIVCIQPPVTNY